MGDAHEGYWRWVDDEVGDMRWICDAFEEVCNEVKDKCDAEAADMDAG